MLLFALLIWFEFKLAPLIDEFELLALIDDMFMQFVFVQVLRATPILFDDDCELECDWLERLDDVDEVAVFGVVELAELDDGVELFWDDEDVAGVFMMWLVNENIWLCTKFCCDDIEAAAAAEEEDDDDDDESLLRISSSMLSILYT